MNFNTEFKLSPFVQGIILVFICILLLIPFSNKAFNIDDPIFIWTAKNIHVDFLNFYGFNFNWIGIEMPMWLENQNPPLVSYYLALVGYFFGWNEYALHFAFIIPAITLIIGTYLLSKELCNKPVFATLFTMFSPVFLVSSTSVMCDIMMLSLFVLSIFFWLRGFKENSNVNLMVSSLLVAACSLTKYFGMSLIPLLLAYSIAEKRSIGRWVLFLLIPISILLFFQWGTYALYGTGLLMRGVEYSKIVHGVFASVYVIRPLTSIVFIGGCLVGIILFSPMLWKRWVFVIWIIFIVLFSYCLTAIGKIGKYEIITLEGVNWIFAVQFSLLAFGGINYIAVTVFDVIKYKDSKSMLIFLWSIGTLMFACFINWTVNGRTVLPLAPVCGILLARHFDQQNSRSYGKYNWQIILPLVPALLISIWVAVSDYKLANSARSAAQKIYSTYGSTSNNLWFVGHWGFQYYMEQLGGKPINFQGTLLKEGDIVVYPENNCWLIPLPKEYIVYYRGFQFPVDKYITVFNQNAGAGFYSDLFGPLPFALGYNDNYERYHLLLVTKTFWIKL